MMEEEKWSVVGKSKKTKTGSKKHRFDPMEDSSASYAAKVKLSLKENKENLRSSTNQKTHIPMKVKDTQTHLKMEDFSVPLKKSFKNKSLQAALISLDTSELREHLVATRQKYDNDLVQMKALVSFLNEKIRLDRHEDSLIFDKPLNYPANILPSALKLVIKEVISSSKETLMYLFHFLMQSLCDDMNKSRPFAGTLIVLQSVAHHFPAATLANLASTVILRNSYQNQSSICCLMFWILSTSASTDITIGVRVWLEIISAVINVRTYTKFTLEILNKILSTGNGRLRITNPEYMKIVEALMQAGDLNAKTKTLKFQTIEMLNQKMVENCDFSTIPEMFMIFLHFAERSPGIFAGGIATSVLHFPSECVEIWEKNFELHRRSSVFFFRFLENNLCEHEHLLENRTFLKFIKNINVEEYPELKFAKDIPAKMTDNKKQKKQKKNSNGSSGSCCRWFFGSFVLFAAIAGLISYDTHVLHGGKFEESSLGGVLKQAGVLPHVENAWFVSMKFSARGYKWVEEQAPVAYSKTRTFMQPYCEFAKDFAITAFNGAVKGWQATKGFVLEKTPAVVAFIDNYVPGLGQKIHDFIVNTSKSICSVTCNAWRSSVDFFKTKVFIGQLSPENIGKAFNSTTQRALTYYSWFHEKVDFYAKIK